MTRPTRPRPPEDAELLRLAPTMTRPQIARHFGCSERAVYSWIAAARGRAGAVDRPERHGRNPAIPSGDRVETSAPDPDTLEVVTTGTVRTLDGLLDAAEVDRADWHVETWTANKWDGITSSGKGEDRVNAVVELWQVKARLIRRPTWYVQPASPLVHLRRTPDLPGDRGLRTALVVPDTQHGYRYDATRRALTPLHDRAACDVAVQAADLLRPQTIILLGDHLDLAPWSEKFPSGAGLRFTTQPAILELHWLLGQLRQASPSSRIVYLEGNHEHRLETALVARLPEGETIRPADDATGHPSMSVPRLLALDALDVEYVGPYGSERWVDGVRAHHGQKVRARGGETVAAILRDATDPEVVGHIHRCEVAWRTLHRQWHERRIWAMSPGTLAHTDGRVPGAARPDWQQGIGIITWDGEDSAPTVATIQRGRCVLYGQQIEGRERVGEISEATGYEFGA